MRNKYYAAITATNIFTAAPYNFTAEYRDKKTGEIVKSKHEFAATAAAEIRANAVELA